ncbi:MAG: 50S ribosomal protein L28 [Candidatus Omnitrophota bacterium]
MLKICAICNKGPMRGNSLSRKGLAKKKGGTGRKTTRVNKRRFMPNLQKIRAKIEGRIKTIYICAKCLKKGKVVKII